MLDKTNAKVVNKLVKLCPNGYKVFELSELCNLFLMKEKELNECLNYLKDNEFLDIKYSDESVVCLCMLPKSKLDTASEIEKGYSIKTVLKTILWSGIFSGFMAFFGSCLARLIIR